MSDILLKNFYTTPRKSLFLTDNGGPFGLDIHFALEVDYCINAYNCDCIFETGTNGGDTTEFLAKQYPDKQIISCESNKDFFEFAEDRLAKYSNVLVLNESSEKVIKKYGKKFNIPFFYLDAHWHVKCNDTVDYWPIIDELKNISKGVICVSDFSVNNFVLREYGREPVLYGHEISDNGDFLEVKTILNAITPSTEIYVNNIENLQCYEYPSLQSIRRCGRAYFCKNLQEDKFKLNKYFMLQKNLMKTPMWGIFY